jgi:hypothetical protein
MKHTFSWTVLTYSILFVMTAFGASAQQGSRPAPAKHPASGDLQGATLEEPVEDPLAGAPKTAASAGKYDILGIRIGMPGKEAAAILRGRNQYQMTPETVKYDFLPAPLMYGVSAVNQIFVRSGGKSPAGAEKVYLMLTMPPSQQIVSKVSRFLMFTKESAPTSDGLVADLVKKYGRPSYDSHPANLYTAGYRELYWVDDAQGNRQNEAIQGGSFSTRVNNCRSITTFSPSTVTYNDSGIEADPVHVKLRLERGYSEQYGAIAQCADMTMIYAKILYGYPIGVSSPDVAGGLIVVIGSAPLDRMATDATHNYLTQAAKSRDMRQKAEAQRNKPAL